MQITDIRVKFVDPATNRPGSRPMIAACSVCFDHVFVIHEVKVIGPEPYLVTMPSRRLHAPCPTCRSKNYLNSNFCSHCGLPATFSQEVSSDGRIVFECNVAHPTTREFRRYLIEEVIRATKEAIKNRTIPVSPLSGGVVV